MIPINRIKSIKLEMATGADDELESFDNTKLTGYNTCPTYGILRYSMHKRMPGEDRAMALEAGAAAHDCFAAIRVYQLGYKQGKLEHAERRCLELFGKERGKQILAVYNEKNDDRTNAYNFALEALHTSGFYDDPNDRRKTTSAIEEAVLVYIDDYDFARFPVYISSDDPQSSFIGIEIAFNIRIEFVIEERIALQYGLIGGRYNEETLCRVFSYRFVGRMDGLHLDGDQLVIEENKTASRINEAWLMSFRMAHQVTGYNIAASVVTGLPCYRANVRGLCVPLPRNYDYGGNVREHVRRDQDKIDKWFEWFLHTTQIHERYKHDVLNAPIYTHSCNRYFRACSMLPFCDSPYEDKEQVLSEMVHDEWSPLHE